MKKVLVFVLLCISMNFSVNAQALSGAAFSMSIKENEDHAGLQNFTSELYCSNDGRRPGWERGAAFLQESNTQRPAVPNHLPEFPNDKVWMLIKSSVIGAEDIRSIDLIFKRDNRADSQIIVPGELSGPFEANFWIDMSQFRAGSYPMVVKVTHMGGEVTYQLLFFIVRSKKEVTDQAIYYLTVYDPARPYTPAEIALSKIIRGFEPGLPIKAYKMNTGKDLPIPMVAPNPPVSTTNTNPSAADFATVQLSVFANQSRTLSGCGTFRLMSVDGTYVSEYKTGSVLQFVVPAGRCYQVRSKEGRWQLYKVRNQISVSSSQTTDLIIQKKGGR